MCDELYRRGGDEIFPTTVKGPENDRPYGYYYLVDGSIKVGDPYARLVLDPDNDKYIPESVYPGLPKYPVEKVQGVALAIYQGISTIMTGRWRTSRALPLPTLLSMSC